MRRPQEGAGLSRPVAGDNSRSSFLAAYVVTIALHVIVVLAFTWRGSTAPGVAFFALLMGGVAAWLSRRAPSGPRRSYAALAIISGAIYFVASTPTDDFAEGLGSGLALFFLGPPLAVAHGVLGYCVLSPWREEKPATEQVA